MKILIPVGCRSDQGLSAPIIKRLRENLKFEVLTLQLKGGDFLRSAIITDQFLSFNEVDMVFITGDRIEMCACVSVAFHKGIKIAHLGAGIVNDPITTLDGINRHCISLWSDILFCESLASAMVISRLFAVKNKELTQTNAFTKNNVHIVGITHLDDLEVSEGFIPDKPYDLLLYNPNKNTPTEFEEVMQYINKNTFIIGGNPDPYANPIHRLIIEKKLDYLAYYDNLTRPDFMGLLKKCKRFISNSSCVYYEAPHFLKPEQIIQIGNRNKNRSTPKKLKTGASDRIVEVLEKYV